MRRRTLLGAGAALFAAPAAAAPPQPAPPQPAPPQPVPPPAARPLSRLDTPWWRARHEAVLRRLRAGPTQLLLIGDSITQDLERRGPLPEMDYAAVWDRFHAPRRAVNLGFKGDSTAHLLWRLRNGELDATAPRAAQVLIGANNFGRARWDAAATEAGIEAVLAEIARRLPRAGIVLIGVLPSRRSAWVDQQTAALNRRLAARYRPGGAVRFVDATPLFLKDGTADETAFYDRLLRPPEPALHPTAASWMRLAELVEPHLAALLGAPPR